MTWRAARTRLRSGAAAQPTLSAADATLQQSLSPTLLFSLLLPGHEVFRLGDRDGLHGRAAGERGELGSEVCAIVLRGVWCELPLGLDNDVAEAPEGITAVVRAQLLNLGVGNDLRRNDQWKRLLAGQPATAGLNLSCFRIEAALLQIEAEGVEVVFAVGRWGREFTAAAQRAGHADRRLVHDVAVADPETGRLSGAVRAGRAFLHDRALHILGRVDVVERLEAEGEHVWRLARVATEAVSPLAEGGQRRLRERRPVVRRIKINHADHRFVVGAELDDLFPDRIDHFEVIRRKEIAEVRRGILVGKCIPLRRPDAIADVVAPVLPGHIVFAQIARIHATGMQRHEGLAGAVEVRERLGPGAERQLLVGHTLGLHALARVLGRRHFLATAGTNPGHERAPRDAVSVSGGSENERAVRLAASRQTDPERKSTCTTSHSAAVAFTQARVRGRS